MIKVIACDLDGTLLNGEHVLSERSIRAIKDAQSVGIRFMVSTGRKFEQVIHVFENTDIECDYIVNSGAEIRNPKKEILHQSYMSMDDCRTVNEVLQQYPVTYLFGAEDADYCIGTTEDRERELIAHIQIFQPNLSEKEVRETALFQFMMKKTKTVSSFEELIKINAKIIKIFVISGDYKMLNQIELQLQENQNLAVASSFKNNIEITDAKAQKGFALKAYIESLGYAMDEVMVFGDSMNDYSMLVMDFGATIAMENAMEKVKEVAKYVTKSNTEDGVAYAIEMLLSKKDNVI